MQGFNMGRYYPPDASNTPRFNTTSHPLGSRAKKINQGILTVRFELPFAVWCKHCTPAAIVGQGVRFNAEKKKVGAYHSTPIWSFRIKHTACGGWWEIHTDPKNSAYVVVSGAQKRDYGDDDGGREDREGEMRFMTEEERSRRREDAFAGLEGRLQDQSAETRAKERVEELIEGAEVWKDTYGTNAKLRREFRSKRKAAAKDHRYKQRVQDKYGLSVEIAEAAEADSIRSKTVEFGAANKNIDTVELATRKPLFAPTSTIQRPGSPGPKRLKLKSEVAAEKSKQTLQSTLVGNSRASVDPFLSSTFKAVSKSQLGILKRKRDIESASTICGPNTLDGEEVYRASSASVLVPSSPGKLKQPGLMAALVDYDSD